MEEPNDKTKRGRELRNGMSPPEIILWKAIRGERLGYTVNRQKPFGRYFLDFYIAKLKVAIEVDGRIHEDTYQHDHKRDNWLESQGVIVIRIAARSIFESVSDVVEYLEIRVNEIAEERQKNHEMDLKEQGRIPPQD